MTDRCKVCEKSLDILNDSCIIINVREDMNGEYRSDDKRWAYTYHRECFDESGLRQTINLIPSEAY